MSEAQFKHKVNIKWSSNFAYAVGVLTSDGYLSSDQRHINLKSADYDFVESLKTALSLNNKITPVKSRTSRMHYQLQFGDIAFYRFLNSIGITSAKSRTIKSVNIPERFFPNFLRGLFNGDGTCYSFWDKRWPNSFVFQIAFASASPDFIQWLKNKLTKLYGVNGYIKKGAGVLNLSYQKGDSRKLAQVMYYKNNILFLKRKYEKINNFIKKDDELILQRKQKRAELAHR